MFIAIVMPPFKQSSQVKMVVAIAAGTSVALAFAPVLSQLSSGWHIIIATLVAAGLGATFFPHQEPATGPELSGGEAEKAGEL